MCEQAEQGLRVACHLRSYAGMLTQVDASWPVMTPIRFDGRPSFTELQRQVERCFS